MRKALAAAVAASLMSIGEASAADQGPKIGLVQIDLSNPFHLGEVEGAKEAARRFGFRLVVASGDGDVNKQIQVFENMINEGVDAIAVNFIDAKAFGPTMKKAAAAHTPVICLHSKIDGCTAVLGFDERYTGKMVGTFAAGLLKARYNGVVKGEVANLEGLLGQGLNTDRSGGFTDVMKQYPEVKVVAQEPTGWDPGKAVSITENWLTAYPHLDLIYGNSDSLTVPAAKVIDRVGKQDQVMLVSVDGTEGGLQAVKSGKMESTVLLAPQYSGFWKAYLPYLIAAKKPHPDEIMIQGVLVTKDNVDTALKVADDQVHKLEAFPFEKPLKDILASYK
ncbi:MAG TPA: sugar ABC transporter substrate-binding protein [Lichenihabitans sp.]|nr:sugar ABC transporter substrate-binding protein [Lichenihabitans sp.]